MRTLIVLLLSLFASAAAHAADLRARCVAAIAANGVVPGAGVKQTMVVPKGKSGVLYQFTDPRGGVFSCDVCDDENPANDACGTMGLRLAYHPKDGDLQDLPAELDKKCVYYLQKELNPSHAPTINHALVKRIQVKPDHTDTRWVYKMQLDADTYRCVIRRSDGNWVVERQKGEEWLSISTTGTMF